MKTGGYWIILLLLVVWSLFDEQIGLPLASWGDPITGTDLCAWAILGISILIIEIRKAANYIVKRLDV